MTITIRHREPKDLEACEKICQQMRWFHNRSDLAAVAESSSGELLGWCVYRTRQKWNFQHVCVPNPDRHQAIGHLLVEWVAKQLPPGTTLEWIVQDRAADDVAMLMTCGVPFRRTSASGLYRFAWTKPAAVPPVAQPEGNAPDAEPGNG